MDAALWSVRGSPCKCCRRELHYCEEEGHCGEDPPGAACRAVFLIRLGRGRTSLASRCQSRLRVR